MASETAQPQGSPFLNLMADLAKDQETRDDFQNDPTAVMQSYGLPQEQIDSMVQAIQNNDQSPISSIFAGEINPDAACFFTQTIYP